MLELHKRILTVVAACALGTSIPASGAPGANPALGRDMTATLTAKHGTVMKRDFVDWNREEWGSPSEAQVSDQLREGMQIGTGSDSWAEVTWPNVKTRAWANTVFAVAPNKRLVYLTGGEMLFRLDKNRRDKDDYYIWTKVLQARIRGTTVLVQAKGPVTRFTVMEGVVELTNRLDKSRTILRPGAVWEIKAFNTQPKKGQDAKPQAIQKGFDGSIGDITYDPQNALPVFQDKFAVSTAYAANSQALLDHPLLKVGDTIDSLPLIQQALKDVPGFSPLLQIKVADAAKQTKVISSAVELLAVPSKANYFVGQSIGKELKLPAVATYDLAPDGVVMNPATLAAASKAAVTAVAPTRVPPPAPVLIPGIPVVDVPAQAEGKTTGASVFEEDPQPLPQVPNNALPALDKLGNTLVPSALPNTCLTPNGAGAVTSNSAFQPMPGAIPNPVPTIGGVLSAGGAATMPITGITNTTALPSSAGLPVTGVTGGAGAGTSLFNAVGGASGAVNNTVNNLTNTIFGH